jgi:IS5 family transposase
MSIPKDERQKDLFRPALDSIIDMHHPLVRLAQRNEWASSAPQFPETPCKRTGSAEG